MIKPQQQTLNKSSVDILNAIRNDGSAEYQRAVPMAANTTASIKEIGKVIMTYQPLQNEFLSALVNRIGKVIVSSKLYRNKFASFKKGILELGDTIEEAFVNIAKPHTYNVDRAESEVFKREIPDVRAAFHTVNYEKFYKQTIQKFELEKAFLSWSGISDLIAKIIDSMYTGAEQDEFLTMKYLIARHVLDGHFYPVTTPVASADSAKEIASDFKAISNDLEFLNCNYNIAGVSTYTNKEDQFLIINAAFDAIMDVNVLATAFNMEKAEFMGHRVLINNFGFNKCESDRIAELFENDPTFRPITAEESTALDNIPAVLIDRDWYMVFDKIFEFNELLNPEGLYWNYWFHNWKIMSVSPFSNAIIFVPGNPSVDSVTVDPATASVSKGQTAQFNAVVATTNYAPKTVIWSINSSKSTIDQTGKLTVAGDETATSIVVTAGFPIVCCGALFWMMIKGNKEHAEEMLKITEALNNNTNALIRLTDKIEGGSK